MYEIEVNKLQLTLEYMPYYYDDDLQLIPNDFSDPDNLRFVIEQDYTSAFSIFTNPDDELSSFESSFLEQWFHRLQAFPLFVCVEVNRYDEEEFEALCRFYSITYNDLTPLADKRFIVAELKHAEDFQRLYSYIHPHASWNDLVIWSTKPNVFRIEYRTHYHSERPEKNGHCLHAGKYVRLCVQVRCRCRQCCLESTGFRDSRSLIPNLT